MAKDRSRKRSNDLYIVPPLILMIVIWAIGAAHWFRYEDILMLIFYGYAGIFVGAGIGGYIASPDRYRPYMRRLIILLLGAFLLLVALVTNHGNMQLEGFFFAILGGGGFWVILHYAIAKIAGPLLFGRVWCGWACWYGMIFDFLPYPFSHYRVSGKWGRLRYLHFFLSLILVAVLLWVFGLNLSEGKAGMIWFIFGVLMYYIVGIAMAMIMKDNRAFCKYLCPIAVPLKLSSQFSLIKIDGIPDHCANCEACVEMCPMNIRVKDYIMAGERVLSSECTLCQTCISVCPHNSLKFSFKFDIGNKDYFDYDPTPGNRDYKAGIKTIKETREVSSLR